MLNIIKCNPPNRAKNWNNTKAANIFKNFNFKEYKMYKLKVRFLIYKWLEIQLRK